MKKTDDNSEPMQAVRIKEAVSKLDTNSVFEIALGSFSALFIL